MQTQTTGKLNIRVAVYGLKIVTSNIMPLIIDGNPQTLNFIVTNNEIKEDGWVGQKKSMTIVYRYDKGPLLIATAKEGEILSIGEKEFARSNTASKQQITYENRLSVLAATYGTDDVTYKIKNLISPENILSFRADNNLFGDSWYGTEKTLIIVLGYGNEFTIVEMFTEKERCYMDLNDITLAHYTVLTA